MAWWGNSLSDGDFSPKQKNKFVVRIGNDDILLSLKSCGKPSVTIEKKEFRMINQYYSYPGIPKWEPITLTFVDGQIWSTNQSKGKTTTASRLWEMLLASGYSTPNGTVSPLTEAQGVYRLAKVVSPEKAAMLANSFGMGGTSKSSFQIDQLDPKGQVVESWRLYNPIITKLSWGDLDYGDDSLVEYQMEVSYDWADLEVGEPKKTGSTVGPT